MISFIITVKFYEAYELKTLPGKEVNDQVPVQVTDGEHQDEPHETDSFLL